VQEPNQSQQQIERNLPRPLATNQSSRAARWCCRAGQPPLIGTPIGPSLSLSLWLKALQLSNNTRASGKRRSKPGTRRSRIIAWKESDHSRAAVCDVICGSPNGWRRAGERETGTSEEHSHALAHCPLAHILRARCGLSTSGAHPAVHAARRRR
jgi:hypothetical protein